MPNRAEKILVRGVNWLGDAVMSTPALIQLRAARPEAEIVLLTPAKLEGLWQGHPALDRVISVPADEPIFSVARTLKREQFATAVVFPNSHRSALEALLARIPRRIGTMRPWRNWMLTQPIAPRAGEMPMHKRTPAEVQRLISRPDGKPKPPAAGFPPTAHHIFQYLHLTATLGAKADAVAPHIAVSAAELKAARERFGHRVMASGESGLVIGVNPGAEYGPAKRWPAERFAAATVAVLARMRDAEYQIWVLGGAADQAIAELTVSRIQAGLPEAVRNRVSSLAGQTSLRELCAVLKACDVVLTNDTGPMHVAAAVGTPVVVPFGSTSAALTGPGWPGEQRHGLLQSDVPCSPCFRRTCPIDFRCMLGLGVDLFVKEVEAVMKAGRRGGASGNS
jgi:heptosyltransferase-2